MSETDNKRPRQAWASAAIVGRPNVGKSTLFNAIVGQPVAITDAMAGTTRDRLIHAAEWEGRRFELIDTGGMGVVDLPEIAGRIEDQIRVAVEEAAVLVFLGDAQQGLTAADREIAARLRRSGKPVVLAVNKVDAAGHEPDAAEFSALGFGEPIPVSALHRRNLGALVSALLAALPDLPPPPAADFTVALVGRRNVGKSTFVNALAGFERVVTDAIPGTTRDSVDVTVEHSGRRWTIVDTAGVRKRGRPENAPEYKSLLRSERALERADAVALLLDAMEGVGALDKRLGALAATSGKPVVIVVNKWDLTTKDDTTGEYEEYLSGNLPGLAFAPVVFASALRKERVWATLRLLRELWDLSGKMIGTALLNRAVGRILTQQPPPSFHGQLSKIFFAVQSGRRPQRFTVRAGRSGAVAGSYRKFFERRLKEELGFEELPVLIRFTDKARRR